MGENRKLAGKGPVACRREQRFVLRRAQGAHEEDGVGWACHRSLFSDWSLTRRLALAGPFIGHQPPDASCRIAFFRIFLFGVETAIRA